MPVVSLPAPNKATHQAPARQLQNKVGKIILPLGLRVMCISEQLYSSICDYLRYPPSTHSLKLTMKHACRKILPILKTLSIENLG